MLKDKIRNEVEIGKSKLDIYANFPETIILNRISYITNWGFPL